MFLFFLHCILWWGVVPFVVDAESIFCSHSFGLAIVVFERVAQVPDERIGDEMPTYQAKFWLFFVGWKIPVASLAVCSNAVAMHSTKKSRSGYPDVSIRAKMAVHRMCCQPLKCWSCIVFLIWGGLTTPACLWGNNVFIHTCCTIVFWGVCIKHRSSEFHCVYHVFV